MINVIYGAGIYGEIFCKEIEVSGRKIDLFIDQYTNKKTLYGKKVKRLEEVPLDNANIFISITSHPKVEVELINTLKKLGVENIYSFIEVLQLFPGLIKKCVVFTKAWYASNKDEMLDYKKLQGVRELLNDEKSKLLLDNIISFREKLTPNVYPTPDLESQYFPEDIDLFKKIGKIRFVDGGAFVGDTVSESILEFKKLNKQIDYIVSFEPDRVNIDKLSQEIANQKKCNSAIDFFIYPCGLWSSNEVLKFSNNNGPSSSIVNKIGESSISIMTVALDKTLVGAAPNYIKMDIEGAEKEAILGAKEIIAENSPTLAICLYHKPQDIWELPLLINSINPNYDMYIRLYGSMGLELVLYCVAKDTNISKEERGQG